MKLDWLVTGTIGVAVGVLIGLGAAAIGAGSLSQVRADNAALAAENQQLVENLGLMEQGIGLLRHGREQLEADQAARMADVERRLADLEARAVDLPIDSPQAEIEAAGFVLRGPDGKVAARLGFDRMGKLDGCPGLYLYDRNGTKRLVAVYTEWGSGVAAYDPKGTGTFGLTDEAYTTPNSWPLGHPGFTRSRVLAPTQPAPANWFSDRPPAN